MSDAVGVVGMWHLGCSIAAAWLTLGRRVQAVEFDRTVAADLAQGRAPLFEPGLDDVLTTGLSSGHLSVATTAETLKDCDVVFIAYDTPVDDRDASDVGPIERAIDAIATHLARNAIVVVSAQMPVGTCRMLRARLQRIRPDAELAYSPENLRLGESIKCYLQPGHIVVGAETAAVHSHLARLFEPMNATIFAMSLPSAEMVKHGINSFLATSVTLANQWSDIADAYGADFDDIAGALRADPRIGGRAYISPGIGFSGGTLGRDLRVLSTASATVMGDTAPLFSQVWEYNASRASLVARRIASVVADGGVVALLGMTYKPGTSTLRRSLPLAIAAELCAGGVQCRAFDPRADWDTVELPKGLQIATSVVDALRGASLVVVLTEWPEFREIDFAAAAHAMQSARLLDPKRFLSPLRSRLIDAGFEIVPLVSDVRAVAT